ncbi:MAG: acyl-CoA desaturase [Gemmatimonadota bacterium]
MSGYAILSSPWWVPILYVVLLGHVTNLCVTLYLHRSATHGGVKFHPVVEHFMRFWLWLTTAQETREWVAVHRKHHAFPDREGDPHSPVLEGFWRIALGQVWFYRKAAQDPEVLEKYGTGCPDDWLERNVYSRHTTAGVLLMVLIDVYLFGALIGLILWSVMAVWVPIFGGVINGVGHALGYRNFDTRDKSRNIYPWGIWIVGEELHNNHHADPRSAKFRAHWWEVDIGWLYIRVLSILRLARVFYARTMSAKEFAARYYERTVGRPVSAGIDRAAAGIERARAQARAGIDRVRSEAWAELEQALEMWDHARERLDGAMEAAWSGLKNGAQEELAEARERLERALEQARAALEEARITIERAAAPELEGADGA